MGWVSVDGSGGVGWEGLRPRAHLSPARSTERRALCYPAAPGSSWLLLLSAAGVRKENLCFEVRGVNPQSCRRPGPALSP